jgi:hypothetical protein
MRCKPTGYQHEGNLNLGELILRHTEVYAQSKTKDEKSAIVSSIVAEVRRLSPNGGFVKREGQGWYEVGSFLAREKISQVFRNILQDQYKSSTNMRRVVRQAQRQFLRAGKTTTDGTTATPGAGGCDDKNTTTGTSILIEGVPADRRRSNKGERRRDRVVSNPVPRSTTHTRSMAFAIRFLPKQPP